MAGKVVIGKLGREENEDNYGELLHKPVFSQYLLGEAIDGKERAVKENNNQP